MSYWNNIDLVQESKNANLINNQSYSITNINPSYFNDLHNKILIEDNSWGWESGSNNLITTVGKGIGAAINWVMPEGLSKWLGVGTAGGANNYQYSFGYSKDQLESTYKALQGKSGEALTKAISELPSELKTTLTNGSNAVKPASELNFDELAKNVKGTASSLMTHIADAGKWVQAHPKELSYYGLAAAGLLGGFYLLKKFLNRKDKNEQIDPKTLAYAQKLDNMSPQQVRQQMGNQQLA